MNQFYTEKMESVVAAAAGGQVPPELPGVLYSLGRDAETEEEYDWAFSLLMRLADHPSPHVVSLVILSLSLLAVFHGRLDREAAEPVIRRGWALAKGPDRGRIWDAVEDIRLSLGWDLTL